MCPHVRYKEIRLLMHQPGSPGEKYQVPAGWKANVQHGFFILAVAGKGEVVIESNSSGIIGYLFDSNLTQLPADTYPFGTKTYTPTAGTIGTMTFDYSNDISDKCHITIAGSVPSSCFFLVKETRLC
jgi:hypothetical protein